VFIYFENLVIIFVSVLSLRNYEKLESRIINLYSSDFWARSTLYLHCSSCVLLFTAALVALFNHYTVIFTMSLVGIYALYCYSNVVVMKKISLTTEMIANEEKTKSYLSLLASTLAVAKSENLPALIGYAVLSLFVTVFFVASGRFTSTPPYALIDAFVAGAAIVHLAVSGLTFGQMIELSDEADKQGVPELMISAIPHGDAAGPVAGALRRAADDSVNTIYSAIIYVLLILVPTWIIYAVYVNFLTLRPYVKWLIP
jgi:hypothetical protein